MTTKFNIGDKVQSEISKRFGYAGGEIEEIRENSITIVWFKWGYVKPEDRTSNNVIREYAYRRENGWFDGVCLIELVESAKITEEPKENTTETTKTAPKSNDSMYPAIVTIGGENRGEVKPNSECSENRYGQLVKSDEYGEYLEPTDKSKAYAQRKLTQYKRLITLISTEERKVEKQIADCREKSPSLQFGGLAWKRNKQLIAVLENRLKVLTKRHYKILGYRWHFLATQFATEVWQLEKS